jgi:hypothetical protein
LGAGAKLSQRADRQRNGHLSARRGFVHAAEVNAMEMPVDKNDARAGIQNQLFVLSIHIHIGRHGYSRRMEKISKIGLGCAVRRRPIFERN